MAAEEVAPKPLSEVLVEASGQAEISGDKIDYRAQSGTLLIKDENGKDKASVFYAAYFLRGQPSPDRPITFCFNGGPGASSVWLNIGLAGPKRLKSKDLTFLAPPYELENNPSSLLDLTDLVFIDPPATGLSYQTTGIDNKPFFGVEEDAQLMVDFIKQFTIKMKRWDSPKYLMGESYGGLRASLVACQLHDRDGFYLNGLLFISPALDLQTIVLNQGNDLPYILTLPGLAKAAQFHQKAKSGVSEQELEHYAKTRYATALLMGDLLDTKEKEAIAQEISGWIGLPKSFILENNLRVSPSKFRKELLKEQNLLLGRFDSRMTGYSLGESSMDYDPSLDAIFGGMTAAFNQYLLKDLKWPEIKEYKPLVSLQGWNWGKGNQYVNAYSSLRTLLTQNPRLKVFVALGDYDLAVSPFANKYFLQHLDLIKEQKERIKVKTYPAGHMFYLNNQALVDFKSEAMLLFK